MGKRRPFFRRQYGHLIKVTRSPFRREQILEGEELARDKRETLSEFEAVYRLRTRVAYV